MDCIVDVVINGNVEEDRGGERSRRESTGAA